MQKHEDLEFLQIGTVVTNLRHTTKMYHTKKLLGQNFFGDYECDFENMMGKILKSANQSLVHNHLHSPLFTSLMAGYGSYEHTLPLCGF